jgi:hypothetical protein
MANMEATHVLDLQLKLLPVMLESTAIQSILVIPAIQMVIMEATANGVTGANGPLVPKRAEMV